MRWFGEPSSAGLQDPNSYRLLVKKMLFSAGSHTGPCIQQNS